MVDGDKSVQMRIECAIRARKEMGNWRLQDLSAFFGCKPNQNSGLGERPVANQGFALCRNWLIGGKINNSSVRQDQNAQRPAII